jgi:hypothetical protein
MMAEAQQSPATKPYVVKESGKIVQAGVPLRAGQYAHLTDEQYEQMKALVYTPEEGEKVKTDMAKAREERRAAQAAGGNVVVESATEVPAQVPSPSVMRTR